MMNRTGYSTVLYLAAILCLPCLLSLFFFGQWFPYFLPGKHFLLFYLMFMLAGYGGLITVKITKPRSEEQSYLVHLLMGLTCMIALSRIVQGIYHHKPVGFLVMLTFIHLIILFAVSGIKAGSAD